MAPVVGLEWMARALARQPVAWLAALVGAAYVPLVAALTPHGITTGGPGAASSYEVAFMGALLGAWLGTETLARGPGLLGGLDPLAATALRGAGTALAAGALGLPVLVGAAAAGRPPDLVGLSVWAGAVFHLVGVALLVDRWAPRHRAAALFAAAWVLPILLMADRAPVGIVTAIPSALVPTWPGPDAAPGPAPWLAGIALWGTAGLLHRPRRPPR